MKDSIKEGIGCAVYVIVAMSVAAVAKVFVKRAPLWILILAVFGFAALYFFNKVMDNEEAEEEKPITLNLNRKD